MGERNILTKTERRFLMTLAERAAAYPAPGNHFTHEDRVMICFSVCCAIYRINKRKAILENKLTKITKGRKIKVYGNKKAKRAWEGHQKNTAQTERKNYARLDS